MGNCVIMCTTTKKHPFNDKKICLKTSNAYINHN